MQDKSPLKYTIVRQMACLDPRNMFSDPYVPGKNETTCSVFRFLQDNQLSGGVSAGTYVFRSLAECTLSLYTVKLVQSQHNTILIVVWFSKCFHDIDWLFLCVIYFVFICFMTGDVIVQHFGNVFSLEAKAESFFPTYADKTGCFPAWNLLCQSYSELWTFLQGTSAPVPWPSNGWEGLFRKQGGGGWYAGGHNCCTEDAMSWSV